MKKESNARSAELLGLLQPWPQAIRAALQQLAAEIGGEVYLVGGTVRDRLLGLVPGDLDLTVARDAAGCCRALIRLLGGGTFVDLGGTGEDVARVVWHGLPVDISGFRGRAETIEDDLRLRDYTLNAMAVPLASLVVGNGRSPVLIDPLHGCDDLRQGVLRSPPQAFADDPLRMLRGFRLMATLGFSLDEGTLEGIARSAPLIERAAAERINHELDLIMESDRACRVLRVMDTTGLFSRLVPELQAGLGVEQPGFHHLDVFHHSFLALEQIEAVIEAPGRYYPAADELLQAYLADGKVRRCLKWAALLHDIGKPATMRMAEDPGDRVTFHNHDEVGRDIFAGFAGRLKWSNEERERTGGLIAMHMHPFHLCNVRRRQPLSKRAVLKLSQRAGTDLCGLFLLAMADSLASRGELKPPGMEEELADLFATVMRVVEEDIRPLAAGPPLLSGRDLIEVVGLEPGPVFTVILRELAALRVEGRVTSRAEALAWVTSFLADNPGYPGNKRSERSESL